MEETKLIIKYAKILKKAGILPGSSGNISIRLKNKIYITPSGISKDEIDEKDLSCININGDILNGIKPSSEFRLHIEIYKTRDDINAIIHAHPPFVLSCMILDLKIDYSLTVEFEKIAGKPIVVGYEEPGSQKIAQKAAYAARKSNIILLKRHGIVALGKNLSQARIIAEDTENLFMINYLTQLFKKLG